MKKYLILMLITIPFALKSAEKMSKFNEPPKPINTEWIDDLIKRMHNERIGRQLFYEMKDFDLELFYSRFKNTPANGEVGRFLFSNSVNLNLEYFSRKERLKR